MNVCDMREACLFFYTDLFFFFFFADQLSTPIAYCTVKSGVHTIAAQRLKVAYS